MKNALGENLTFAVGPLVAKKKKKMALFAVQTAFPSPPTLF